MIRYSLSCANAHDFDSWFQSADAFDKLMSAGMVTCAVCGGTDVQKSVMAPNISKSADRVRPLSAPASTAEQAFRELREKVEANSENVGRDFVKEARAMHNGEAPERSIHGEAKPAEAKKLIEDGVPVLPLLFMPTRKTN